MTTRIQELAEQAKFIAEEDINRQISYNAELRAFAEKFAQLIVAEVLAVQENFIANGHNAWHLNKPTREHFGVEE